jgi:hypothetical protein
LKQTHLDYQVIWEDWNLYRLENNIILKIKIPVSNVIEDTEASKPGEKYKLDLDILQKVHSDVDLHEPSADTTIKPEDIQKQIGFEPLEERPQIYYIPKNKHILLLKPMIYKVFTTTKYDKNGYPIFWVESNMLLNDIKVPSQ